MTLTPTELTFGAQIDYPKTLFLMNKLIARKIKDMLCVITLLEARVIAFKEDLQYFTQRMIALHEDRSDSLHLNSIKFENPSEVKNRSREIEVRLLAFGLKRLEHEVMFLCIEAHSLYEGIEKRKSLLNRIIKQYGREISKVDKKPSFEDKNIIDMGVFEDGANLRMRNRKELQDLLDLANRRSLKARKELSERRGIKSGNHNEIDAWMCKHSDREAIEDLAAYRKAFAHRLNELWKIEQESKVSVHPMKIDEMLTTISKVLTSYKSMFQVLLGYMFSEHYEGIGNFRYESLSRLKEFQNQLDE